MRADGRKADELRPVRITPGYTKYAAGSVLIEFGDTKVLCTATVEPGVPPFLRGGGKGWVTAEYAMLPSASQTRIRRDIASLRQAARGVEIQRLIGRSLRAAVDLQALGENTVTVDCDVLQADGGTRTASITGGYVALALALIKLQKDGVIASCPLKGHIAAVSAGIFEDNLLLDLCYSEDSGAQADINIVMNDAGELIELQGTGEKRAFSKAELSGLLALCEKGIKELIEKQKEVIGDSIYTLPRRAAVTKLLIASGNRGKIAEMRALLQPLGIEVVSPGQVGIDIDPSETGSSFEENALQKARAYCKASGLPAAADDSGLCVDALGGEPGIYSARFGGKISDAQRTALLLERLSGVEDDARGAHFYCAMALCLPDGREFAVNAKCFGSILNAPRGENGFGYDPVFFFPAAGKTFAEMDEGEKNAVSHRAQAAQKFCEEIKKYISA